MNALVFGILSALCWGVHDFLVQRVSHRAGVMVSVTSVLGTGLLLVGPLALASGQWGALSAGARNLAMMAGVAYAFGGYSLYRAFDIGPIRLVAPIIGAYPILSLGWAALNGQPLGAGQVVAVLAVVTGVGLVAIQSDRSTDAAPRTRAAILWALAAGFGFALTFALGQAAARFGAEWPAVLITRLAAFAILLTVALATGQRPDPRATPWALLVLMGCLDAAALGLVMVAGGLPHPEFAAVASSVFGMITILLAWAFLREPMTLPQWASVALVFAGIGYLAL